jgi:hypothetical protein
MIFLWWDGYWGSRTGTMQTGAMPCGLRPWEKVIHVQHERVNLVAAQFAYVVVGKEGKSGLRIESRDNEVYLPKTTFHVDDFAVINQKGPQDAAKKFQETTAQKLSLRRIGDVKLIPAFHLKAMCDRTASKICIRQVKTPMLPRSCQNTTVKCFENSCLEILVSTKKISHYIVCTILL